MNQGSPTLPPAPTGSRAGAGVVLGESTAAGELITPQTTCTNTSAGAKLISCFRGFLDCKWLYGLSYTGLLVPAAFETKKRPIAQLAVCFTDFVPGLFSIVSTVVSNPASAVYDLSFVEPRCSAATACLLPPLAGVNDGHPDCRRHLAAAVPEATWVPSHCARLAACSRSPFTQMHTLTARSSH